MKKGYAEYGTNSFPEKNLRRMMQFSWTHIVAFIPIQDKLKRECYPPLPMPQGHPSAPALST